MAHSLKHSQWLCSSIVVSHSNFIYKVQRVPAEAVEKKMILEATSSFIHSSIHSLCNSCLLTAYYVLRIGSMATEENKTEKNCPYCIYYWELVTEKGGRNQSNFR